MQAEAYPPPVLNLVPTPDPRRLVVLRDAANERHRAFQSAGISAVEIAIDAGVALLAVEDHLPVGVWEQWVAENFDGSAETAVVYKAMARNAAAIRADNAVSIAAARELMRTISSRPRKRGHAELEREAKALAASGTLYKEIAQLLGVTAEQVTYWMNPGSYQKRLQSNMVAKRTRKAAARALDRENTSTAAKALGTDPRGVSYALIRKAAQAASRIEPADAEERALVDALQRDLMRAEDRAAACVKFCATERYAA